MKKINPKDLEVNPKMRGSSEKTTPSYTEGNCDFTHNICTETQLVDCKNTEVENCHMYTADYDCKDPDKTKTWCESVVICDETEKNCVDSTSKAPICCAPGSDNINCAGSFRNCESRDYCPITEVFTECETDAMCPATGNNAPETKCVCVRTDDNCVESVDMCIMSVDCID